MLEQLAAQLQAAEGRPAYRDNLVPFVVLFTFLLTFWLTYSGLARDLIQYLDLNPKAHASTIYEYNDPSVTINGYTFDQNIDRDWAYTKGYGYPQ